MRCLPRSLARPLIALLLAGLAGTCAAQATLAPGRGVEVRPAQSPLAEESFQTRLVARALTALGYRIAPAVRASYADAHRLIARGEAHFMAGHWDPLHAGFFEAVGGRRHLSLAGALTANAVQGYLVDRKTADALGIQGVEQLRDPNIARVFDDDGDGKADLAGCESGWGCRRVIDHQLVRYGLAATVTHHTGPYERLIDRVIERQHAGLPVLFYAWTPHWVSEVLVPGRDTRWLTVPFSSQPGHEDPTRTALPDGTDYGFELNTIRIVVNRAFAAAHPDALALFELLRLPAADISAQNLRMHQGERSDADIERHVSDWIARHRISWEGWLRQARAAAP